jgi:hypothetical protein
MKNHQKGAIKPRHRVLPWDFEKALSALPYLSSVMRSVRNSRLEVLEHHLRAERLSRRPGRADRGTLVAHAEALHAAREADAQYQQTLAELQALDVYCLDPIAGQALIPFIHRKQLAWYVFDLFDPNSIRYWRYQTDPPMLRRRIRSEKDER